MLQEVPRPKTMESNERLKLALDFVLCTDKCIFLTGKAGTGKTTFLQNIKKSISKRMAIVAPTGVAAINAGGVTIHSFFQMPFGPIIPPEAEDHGSGLHLSQQIKRFRRDKIKLIKSLDLLVIDEISMVRADLLDGIDQTLRHYRNPEKPFGGVQVLMIGDMHQLPPVVKDEDWKFLSPYYKDLYFFNSRVYQQCNPVCVELNHIYRQSDPLFIGLLNKIRENDINHDVLNALNERYVANFNPQDDENYITLTTHNHTAQETNRKKLAALTNPTETFDATIQNDFPEFSFPTDQHLELKVGAQVMFVKNDVQDKLYYNGKIGKITSLSKNEIKVKCPGEYVEITVKPVEWQNLKYELNEKTKELEEKIIGKFSQFPLKLAWAITIHKSQGLTFERAIIDASLAFAHGQVYVALSRCKSFEGMVLSSPIGMNSVRTDRAVRDFTLNINDGRDCGDFLAPAKHEFQRSLMFELFDLKRFKAAIFRCTKIMEDHYNAIEESTFLTMRTLKAFADDKLYVVSESFQRQLQGLIQQQEALPEENELVQERVKKASQWFAQQFEEQVVMQVINLAVDDIDNKAVKETLAEALQNLRIESLVKFAVFSGAREGFDTLNYLKLKVDTELDALNKPETKKIGTRQENKKIANAPLYHKLNNWRNELAEEQHIPVYMILPQKTLLEICSTLPSSLKALEGLKGIGAAKLKAYGKDIVSFVIEYCEDSGIQKEQSLQFSFDQVAQPRTPTRELSFQMFKEGRSVQEISVARGLVVSTIETHLTHYIGTGELNIDLFVEERKRQRIENYLREAGTASITVAKTTLGDEVSYSELRAVIAYMKAQD